jgi:hypothetical protein
MVCLGLRLRLTAVCALPSPPHPAGLDLLSASPTASFDSLYESEHNHAHAAAAAAQRARRVAGAGAAAAAAAAGSPSPPNCAPSPAHAAQAKASARTASPAAAAALACSLVRVPPVLRALFKLDRQLRGLELEGVMLLPHTYLRADAGRSAGCPELHLDVVIA